MPIVLALLIAVGSVTPGPLMVEAAREEAALEVRLRLAEELPAASLAALTSGAEVRLAYPVRVKAKRRGWWDRRVWAAELVTIAAFDPVTGRYRCQVVLDGVINSTAEVESVDAAHRWLIAPPAVRIELPPERRDAELKVRVRAVFSRGTTWLIFPTQEATPWTEISLDAPVAPADSGE